jgi:hypothetical protein
VVYDASPVGVASPQVSTGAAGGWFPDAGGPDLNVLDHVCLCDEVDCLRGKKWDLLLVCELGLENFCNRVDLLGEDVARAHVMCDDGWRAWYRSA